MLFRAQTDASIAHANRHCELKRGLRESAKQSPNYETQSIRIRRLLRHPTLNPTPFLAMMVQKTLVVKDKAEIVIE